MEDNLLKKYLYGGISSTYENSFQIKNLIAFQYLGRFKTYIVMFNLIQYRQIIIYPKSWLFFGEMWPIKSCISPVSYRVDKNEDPVLAFIIVFVFAVGTELKRHGRRVRASISQSRAPHHACSMHFLHLCPLGAYLVLLVAFQRE